MKWRETKKKKKKKKRLDIEALCERLIVSNAPNLERSEQMNESAYGSIRLSCVALRLCLVHSMQ